MLERTVARLYRVHAPAIEAHCRRLLGHGEARDALQETFVRVLARTEAPASDEHAVRALFRISTNVCIDALRQRRVRRRALHELARASAAYCPDETAGDTLERILTASDEPTRKIIVLRFLEGRKQDEIAAMLGTSRRTVHARLKRFSATGRGRRGRPRSGQKRRSIGAVETQHGMSAGGTHSG